MGDIERVREVAASARLVDPLRRVTQRDDAGRGKQGHREDPKKDSVEIEAEPPTDEVAPPEPDASEPESGGLDIAA
ncbi:MAG: hypothetical protein WHU10_04720 [Fimbriimonadales bacterium]